MIMTPREKLRIALIAVCALTMAMALIVAATTPGHDQWPIAWHSFRVHFLEADLGLFLVAMQAEQTLGRHRDVPSRFRVLRSRRAGYRR
jgi:hypothetical protein